MLIDVLATAEPPQNMACAIPLAIRNAVNSARAEADPKAGDWLRFSEFENLIKAILATLFYFINIPLLQMVRLL